MKHKYKFVTLFCMVLLLAGCDRFGQYSISEDKINQSLKKKPKIEKNLGISGLFQANFTLENLNSRVGRDKPGIVTLSGDGQIHLASLLGNKDVDLQLTLSARPTFNKEQGAIFLQDLTLTDYQVKPEKLTSVVKNLEPLLNRELSTYFTQHPAYVLSAEHSFKERAIKNFVTDLSVTPGALVIKFGR